MRLAVCGFTALVLLALPARAEMSGGKMMAHQVMMHSDMKSDMKK